jgi:hypothetical protein
MKFKPLFLTMTVALSGMTTVFAATTGTLNLQGVVQQALSLAVSAEAGASNLDLSVNASSLKVAAVNETSNSNTGYKIKIRSLNNATLANGNVDNLAYTLTYDGSAVSLSTNDVVAKTQATGGVYDANSDVEISYTGKAPATMVEGTYTDTLTFTIESN